MSVQQIQVNNPSFDFEIQNLRTNFIGVSVSNPLTVFNTTLKDTVYVLNKNTKSVHFDNLEHKDSVLRNRNLSSNDKYLITTVSETVREGDSILFKYKLEFKGFVIGILTIKYAYSYYIKENTLILPFQSFPIHAVYRVINPGVLVEHYYGQSIVEPNRRTGILDMNFIVRCHTKDKIEISEDLTISVNLINGGFVPNENPEPMTTQCIAGSLGFVSYSNCYKREKFIDSECNITYGEPIYDPSYCTNCPQSGVSLGFEAYSSCYKREKFSDGNCGYTYGAPIYDSSYCNQSITDSTIWNTNPDGLIIYDVAINSQRVVGPPSAFSYNVSDWPVTNTGIPTTVTPQFMMSSNYNTVVVYTSESDVIPINPNEHGIRITADNGTYQATRYLSGSTNYVFNNVPSNNIQIQLF